MTRLPLLAETKVFISDRGSAVVGFAIGAPLIALIATFCISLSGYVWSRELMSDVVRQQLHKVSIGEVARDDAQNNIRESLSQKSWMFDSLSWKELLVDGANVLSLQVRYHIEAAALLPPVTISEAEVVQ